MKYELDAKDLSQAVTNYLGIKGLFESGAKVNVCLRCENNVFSATAEQLVEPQKVENDE